MADLQEQVDILTEGPDPDQVTILETQLDMAQNRADSLLVKAPFDGVITALPVQEGDLIQAGSQAAQLDDLSNLYLDVQISEVDIPWWLSINPQNWSLMLITMKLSPAK